MACGLHCEARSRVQHNLGVVHRSYHFFLSNIVLYLLYGVFVLISMYGLFISILMYGLFCLITTYELIWSNFVATIIFVYVVYINGAILL